MYICVCVYSHCRALRNVTPGPNAPFLNLRPCPRTFSTLSIRQRRRKKKSDKKNLHKKQSVACKLAGLQAACFCVARCAEGRCVSVLTCNQVKQVGHHATYNI